MKNARPELSKLSLTTNCLRPSLLWNQTLSAGFPRFPIVFGARTTSLWRFSECVIDPLIQITPSLVRTNTQLSGHSTCHICLADLKSTNKSASHPVSFLCHKCISNIAWGKQRPPSPLWSGNRSVATQSANKNCKSTFGLWLNCSIRVDHRSSNTFLYKIKSVQLLANCPCKKEVQHI